MIEALLIMPVLMVLVLNAINFGYFFLVALNLTEAPRAGAAYSILGFASNAAESLPSPGPPTNNSSVSYLTYRDLTGAINSPTSASIQVCSKSIGLTGSGSSRATTCMTCLGSTCGSMNLGTPAPGSDPEAPNFVMNRVDLTYTFSPLVPGTPLGLALLPISTCSATNGIVTCTFTRHVSMRAMD